MRLLVLGVLVSEALSRPAARQHEVQLFLRRNYARRELSKLVTDHIFGDSDIVVDFAVVDLEDQADKVGQDGGTACLCLDRRRTLAGLGSNDGQSVYPRR
jgi:hypothetical protein